MQLGVLLIDLDSREEVEVLDVIVRPTHWTIPDEAAAVHGITTERALDEGIPEAEALGELIRMWAGGEPERPRDRVAHNEQFDARIIRIGFKRFIGDLAADAWKAGTAHCTAVIATPFVKAPPTAKMKAAGRHHFKTPTLTEAHQHFFGEAFEGAHSAISDARACARVYFAAMNAQRLARAAA